MFPIIMAFLSLTVISPDAVAVVCGPDSASHRIMTTRLPPRTPRY